MHLTSRQSGVILAILIIASVLLNSFGMMSDVENSRVPTETEQINFALKFGGGDFNPHHFIHPPFFAYILFLFYGIAFMIGKFLGVFSGTEAYKVLYFTQPWFFYIIARIVIIGMAAFGIFMTYAIGKKISSKETGILACVLLIFFPSFVVGAHYATGDLPLFFIGLIAFYFIIRVLEKGRLRDYILSGFLIGLAVATKYNGGLLIAPFIAACILSGRNIPSEIGKLLAGLFFILLGFFTGCPFALLDWPMFYKEIVKQFGIMKSLTYQFASWRVDKPGWIYIWTNTLPFSLGILFTILFFISAIYNIFSKNKKMLLVVVLLISYILYTGRWNAIKPRYYLFLFPFIAISVAFFFQAIKNKGIFKKFNFGLVIILLLIPNIMDIWKFEASIADKPISVLAKDWIEKNVPGNSKIAMSDCITIIPSEDSIDFQLEEMKKKGYGQGARLSNIKKYLYLFPKKYNIYILPLPWMENYDPEDFDFNGLVKNGYKYFVISNEFTEYLLYPEKYAEQNKFLKNMQAKCALIKQFRASRSLIEPEFLGENEYILIYELISGR
jgi:hypothetical protein